MSNDRFKFRVFDNINKRYEKDLTLIDKDGDLCYEDGHKYCNGEHPEDFTIEQCTGLTDKNGKLIYEGDVLQAPGQTIAYKVQWAHHGFVVKTGFSSAKSYPMSNCEMFEIIGNIHDEQFRDVTKMMEDKDNGTNESKP